MGQVVSGQAETSTSLTPPQEYPDVSKQPEWNAKVKPDAVDWKATIDEALERGKAVPEVEWCIPGEKAALQARLPDPSLKPSALFVAWLRLCQGEGHTHFRAADWLVPAHVTACRKSASGIALLDGQA